ncbi:MAG TPA: hypothetical protein VK472_01225 [Allosphingosinicella sp.]|nr:hypothetical protein [Allosphingosinicella sp.]
MKSSTLSAALGAVLLLSLGGKLLANRATVEPDNVLFAARAEAALRGAGFETKRVKRPMGLLVYGEGGGCRAMIGEYAPHGTFADTLAKRAAPIGPLRFAWRGRVYGEAPKLMPLAAYYLRRELLRIGLDAPRAPIAAVALTPGCTLLDVAPLASLPA